MIHLVLGVVIIVFGVADIFLIPELAPINIMAVGVGVVHIMRWHDKRTRSSVERKPRECLFPKQEVAGSSPAGSTKIAL